MAVRGGCEGGTGLGQSFVANPSLLMSAVKLDVETRQSWVDEIQTPHFVWGANMDVETRQSWVDEIQTPHFVWGANMVTRL